MSRYFSPEDCAVLRRAVVELSRPNPLLVDLPYVEEAMPIKMGRKTYNTFASAVRAVAKKGIRNPKAYVATIERKEKKR